MEGAGMKRRRHLFVEIKNVANNVAAQNVNKNTTRNIENNAISP